VTSFIGQANVVDGVVAAVGDRRVSVRAAGGAELSCTGSGLTAGTSCRAFIKHERVAVTRVAPLQGDNLFAGTISGRTYLGDSARYLVTTDKGLLLRSLIPHRPGFEHFNVGDKVFAAFAAADSLVFPV
jgi:ABC-type Fe3+/spermidine/putrescine transport system ATPase subunit